MQALGVPSDRFLLLHAPGPLKFRAAEKILEADPIRDQRATDEDDDRDQDNGSDQQFHGYHQVTFCRKQEYA